MFDKWINEPLLVKKEINKIIITAAKNTDFFVDPATKHEINNAPLYVLNAEKEFTFFCKVKPHFNDVYDAGALMYYVGNTNWVKLAFEKTDLGYPAIVSVVTKGYSDDCNGEKIDLDTVWLKMSKKEKLLGLYFSVDGLEWKMHRLFKFDNGVGNRESYFGLETQSPFGQGCSVEFSNLELNNRSVTDFRKGR